MGRVKDLVMMMDDREDWAEYEFYMWMEEEKRREEARRRLRPNSISYYESTEIPGTSGDKKD